MKILLNISKYLMSIGGLTVIIWGGFRIYDNITDGQDQILDEMTTFKNQQGYVMGRMENINNKVNNLHDSLKQIMDHQNTQNEHMASMERAAGFYIRNQKEMTEEAMEDALDVILKKNGLGPIGSNDSKDTTWTENLTFNSNLLIQ